MDTEMLWNAELMCGSAEAGNRMGDSAIVSFIVPVYNHKQFVVRCLDSILECAREVPSELLVIDDGSSDGSPMVVDEWLLGVGNVFVNKIFIKRCNKGVTKTLNEMILHSRGDFVAPVASDDYILKDGFLGRLEYLMRNPNLDAVIGDAIVVDELGFEVSSSAFFGLYRSNRTALILGSGFLVTELLMRWALPGPCGLIRRSVYSEIGYYNEDLRIEDREFYLRLLSRRKVGFYDRAVAAYRIHNSNSSFVASNRSKMNREIASVNINAVHLYKGINSLFLWSYRDNLVRNSGFRVLVRPFFVVLRAILRGFFDLKVRILNLY